MENTITLSEDQIKKITYQDLDSGKFNNVREIVIEAKNLAYRDYQKIKDAKEYSKFLFNYEGTYPSFVNMPNYLLSEVNKEMSTQDFNEWERTKSIYESTLIRDLSSLY